MNPIERFTPLVGRILLAAIFVWSGFNKVTGFEGTAGFMASVGMPMPTVLLVIAIILEIGGGAMLILGFKARIGAAALVVFTVVASFYFHAFWNDPGEMVAFMKNLALIGGLLLVIGFGSGPLSLDKRR